MSRASPNSRLFTPSGPHAASKPPARVSIVDIAGPPPPNETPQEKVARLRAAANKAKAANVSQWDRVVDRGRVWADRAHRFTTLSLIGFTALATVFTVVTLGDMMLYNRRKRNEWYEQQRVNLQKAVREAKEKQALGTASEHDLELIKEDEEVRAEQEAKAAKKGVFARAKDSLFGGYAKEEQRGGKMGIASSVREFTDNAKTDAEPNTGRGIVKAVNRMVESNSSPIQEASPVEQLPQSIKTTSTDLGSLDRLGENVAQAAKQTSKGWWSWATGR